MFTTVYMVPTQHVFAQGEGAAALYGYRAPIIVSSYYQPSTASAGKVIIGSLRVS